jgi:hypothetical protein
VAEGVIGAPAVGIGEDLVGLGGLLELLLGFGVVLVDVGVQLAGKAAKRLLDLAVAGAPADAEDLVVVRGHGTYLS